MAVIDGKIVDGYGEEMLRLCIELSERKETNPTPTYDVKVKYTIKEDGKGR